MGLSAVAGMAGYYAQEAAEKATLLAARDDAHRKEVYYGVRKGTYSATMPNSQNLPKNCVNCGAPKTAGTCAYCLT